MPHDANGNYIQGATDGDLARNITFNPSLASRKRNMARELNGMWPSRTDLPAWCLPRVQEPDARVLDPLDLPNSAVQHT